MFGTIYRRDVDFASPEESVCLAAGRMRRRGVGSLVIVNPEHVPIGIVTDRDFVVRVLGEHLNGERVRIRDVMTPRPVTVRSDVSADRALEIMRDNDCRRLPVVDEEGVLIGIVCLDDLLLRLRDLQNVIGELITEECPGGVACDD